MTERDLKNEYSPLDDYNVDDVDFYIDLIRADLMVGDIRGAETKFHQYFPSRDGISLHKRIQDWIIDTKKTVFNTEELDKECQIVTKRDITNRRKILKRLQADKLIVPDKRIPKRWYVAQGRGRVLDWFNACEDVLPMVFPLGEESLVEIYPKNTLLYAGSWQSGKTAYFLNLAYLNRDNFKNVLYFMSEMGGPEIKKRLKKAKHIDLKEFSEKISMIEQSAHFDEALDPDGLNFIDYLSVKDNFHEVAGIIETIDDALKSGVAVIAIQKPKFRDYGYGGEMTGNRPRLYVSLERGVAKILKGKNWRTDKSPDGLIRTYKIVNGIKFIPVDEWREEYNRTKRSWG